MGLLLVQEGGYEFEIATIHQWAGIAAAFFGCITWFIGNSIHKKNKLQNCHITKPLQGKPR